MQLKVAITGTFFGTKFLAPFAAGVETRNPPNKHKNFQNCNINELVAGKMFKNFLSMEMLSCKLSLRPIYHRL